MLNGKISIKDNLKSWPFLEAKNLLKKINNQPPKKGFVLFETGYGPSGLPHIGTFGEVCRTLMVMRAFNYLAPEIPTKLICFSDDMDALRKVPDNIPNADIFVNYIGKPLTAIPDPYDQFASYGEQMNDRLKKFLDRFSFSYEFYSSTECYKGGIFNDSLKKIALNLQKINSLILPTLRIERKNTYNPFMPICPISGKVLEEGVTAIDSKEFTISFKDINGNIQIKSILDGNCKLQWKVDFGMRWHALDVDYEMFGKDIIPSAELAAKIAKIIGNKSPLNFHYELFLDANGQKISKSKGNGISLDEWLKYAPAESLSYYMYQKPKTAKRLYFDIIPKSTDEYIKFMHNYKDLDPIEKLDNPIYHIHNNDYSFHDMGVISFSLLLNLASACNPDNVDILWGFISKYDPNLNKNNAQFIDSLAHYALNYYNDFVKPHKKFKKPDELEKKAISALKEKLILLISEKDATILQNIVYQVGNDFNFELKSWFQALYQILLGQDSGPRFGSFISLFGVPNMIKLIDEKLA
jgi:lysyl-tRNA synthetase class 1